MVEVPNGFTTPQLCKAANVHRDTLRRWISLGLIQRQHVISLGRGRSGRWPEAVLERIQRIKQMQADGFSLQAVLLEIDRDPNEQAQVTSLVGRVVVAWIERGSGRAFGNDDATLVDVFERELHDMLNQMGLQQATRNRMLQTPGLLADSLESFVRGFDPLLVDNGQSCVVTKLNLLPVLIVRGYLKLTRGAEPQREGEHQGLMVISLGPLLRKLWEVSLIELAAPVPTRRYSLPQVVRESSGEQAIDHDFGVVVRDVTAEQWELDLQIKGATARPVQAEPPITPAEALAPAVEHSWQDGRSTPTARKPSEAQQKKEAIRKTKRRAKSKTVSTTTKKRGAEPSAKARSRKRKTARRG